MTRAIENDVDACIEYAEGLDDGRLARREEDGERLLRLTNAAKERMRESWWMRGFYYGITEESRSDWKTH